MRLGLFLLILSAVPAVLGQAPVTVVSAGWKVDRQPAPQPESQYIPPQKEVTANDKYWARKNRENQPQTAHPTRSETTLDGPTRRSRPHQRRSKDKDGKDVDGYTYRASLKNDTQKPIRIIYWEYIFVGAQQTPGNSVRRQFLCSASIKPGEKKDVWLFSTLGPSETISVESLTAETQDLFDAKAFVNRVEFSDGSVLSRPGWKLSDYDKAIEPHHCYPVGQGDLPRILRLKYE